MRTGPSRTKPRNPNYEQRPVTVTAWPWGTLDCLYLMLGKACKQICFFPSCPVAQARSLDTRPANFARIQIASQADGKKRTQWHAKDCAPQAAFPTHRGQPHGEHGAVDLCRWMATANGLGLLFGDNPLRRAFCCLEITHAKPSQISSTFA